MIGVVTAFALFGGALNFGGSSAHGPDLQVKHYALKGWRIDVGHDRFKNSTVCSIRKSTVLYSHGVLTFRFGHKVDTANAVFRVDDGPLLAVGSVAVKAAGLGAPFNGPNLNNPSDGAVYIPADDVGNARQVSIKPNSKMTHRVFGLTGLSQAIEAAKGQNCDIPH